MAGAGLGGGAAGAISVTETGGVVSGGGVGALATGGRWAQAATNIIAAKPLAINKRNFMRVIFSEEQRRRQDESPCGTCTGRIPTLPGGAALPRRQACQPDISDCPGRRVAQGSVGFQRQTLARTPHCVSSLHSHLIWLGDN